MASFENTSQSHCVNLTDEDSAYLWLYSPLETAIVVGILPCAGILGLIANVAFQIAILKNPDLQTKTNYYLFTLAIFDEVFIIAAAFGWFLGSYLASPVSYALPFKNCWLIIGAIVTCHLASLGLITLVAFDRYIALCYPVKYRNKFTVNLTKKIIVANAIISAVLSAGFQRWGKNISVCIIWPQTDEYANLPTSINKCGSAYNFPFAELLFYDLPFFVALILNTFMYMKIVYSFNRPSMAFKESEDQRKQVTRVLIVNGVAFALSQVPYRLITISDIVEYITESGLFTPEQYEAVLIVGRMFLVLNSTVNPYIYGLTSRFYRREMKKVFCGWYQTKDENQMASVSTVTADVVSKTETSGTHGLDQTSSFKTELNKV